MFGRETRMLLRHYLEHGTSKSALARELGVSRDTIHRWIRDGDLDRDLDALPSTTARAGRRRPSSIRIAPSSRPASPPIPRCRPCGCSRRFAPRDTRAAIPSSKHWCGSSVRSRPLSPSCVSRRRPDARRRSTSRSSASRGANATRCWWSSATQVVSRQVQHVWSTPRRMKRSIVPPALAERSATTLVL
jgi:hypothetical protein